MRYSLPVSPDPGGATSLGSKGDPRISAAAHHKRDDQGVSWALLRLRVRKLAWLVRRPRWWSLIPRGIGPSLEHADMLAGHRYTTVLDIGANVGQFALWAQQALGPQRIICVEPQHDAAERIRQMAVRMTCHVDVIETALGTGSGTAMLYVTAAGDSSSVLGPEPDAQARRPGLRVRSTSDVTVMSGDEALTNVPLPGPVLVKIDVQGSELEVLLGLQRVLQMVSAVLVEVSFEPLYRGQSAPDDVIELLRSQGFELRGAAGVPGGSTGWALDQADLLFERGTAEGAG
jgi:FkbM family methyltransferase